MSEPRYRSVIGDAVREASEECDRFTARLVEYMDEFQSEPHPCGSYKSRSAMLRASMDLTRALARLRKPGATVKTVSS